MWEAALLTHCVATSSGHSNAVVGVHVQDCSICGQGSVVQASYTDVKVCALCLMPFHAPCSLKFARASRDAIARTPWPRMQAPDVFQVTRC
eukprot:13049855-Alexandrium_andersonii.AAC.1